MIHFVFSIQNLANGQLYIGKHSTCRLDDDYLGSGTFLTRAIKAHGRHNFERTIISFHPTAREALDAEFELVTEEIVADPRFYNLDLGGQGGWYHCNKSKQNNKGKSPAHYSMMREKYRLSLKIPENLDKARRRFSLVQSYSQTKEVRARVGLKNSIHQTGTGNSQHGTWWINDGHTSRKIKADSVIPLDWVRGRHKRPESIAGDAPLL